MSKTTENSHSTTKKLYTGAVISAIAATGLVSTVGTAHANEVEIPLPTTAKTDIMALVSRGLVSEFAFNKVKKGYVRSEGFEEVIKQLNA